MARRRNNVIVSAIDNVLSELGFSRHKKTWHSYKPETIHVVDLQKSNWGDVYYISFGVLVRQLSEAPRPKLIECHIFQRLEMLLPRSDAILPAYHEENDTFLHQLTSNPMASINIKSDDPTFFSVTGLQIPQITAALNLEDTKIGDPERERAIRSAIIGYGLPFLANLESLEKIKSALINQDMSTVFVHQSLRALCSVPTIAEIRWYNPLEDTNTHAHAFVADHVDLSDAKRWDLTQGQHQADWKQVVTFWTDNEALNGTPDDVLQHCVVRLPVLSQPLRQALDDGGISGIQYLPARVRRPGGEFIEGYSIANITNVIPALDVSNALVTRYGQSRPDRIGEISSVMKPVLKKSVLAGHDVFRLAEFPLAYYVSTQFRDIFVNGQFTGYSFRQVPLS